MKAIEAFCGKKTTEFHKSKLLNLVVFVHIMLGIEEAQYMG